MRCVSCGTELIPGKRFCHVCGAQAVLGCPRCGATLAPGFRYCPDCGAPIGDAPEPPAPAGDDRLARLSKHIPAGVAEKIRASKGVIGGERKLVTVLFCDLVGSTAIAERLDPEEYRDVLEQYMEIAFREIYAVEGIINMLAGDGVMALFGAPLAHEDAPQRAVRAALAIRDELGTLNQRLRDQRGLELAVRIGIHTGPVVVGTVGNDLKMDYTAIGDTTNLASRLQSLAQPGTILVSASTHRLVRGLFRVREAGPFEVKGKREQVVAHEVLGLQETATPMELAQARGLTPLVGRGEELAQLNACYARLAGNLAQVVAVTGEAGSGKSRLLYEFKRQLPAEPVVFFEARCSSLSQTVPHAPWVGMLRQYFGLDASEDAAGASEKVARKLREHDERLEEIYPLICRMLSLPGAGPGDIPADEAKGQTFEAVARLVHAASQRAAVMMIIEDLHWIDDASREMLELAVTRLGGAPVMLVVSHRPDYQPSWRAKAALTQLHLRPLSDADATAIIRAIVGGPLPAELEQRILRRAEGNPFFVEEITRALVEEGYVLRSDGHVRLTRPVAEMRIPDTVQELIGARLDRLTPHAKRVVQMASVVGRQFSREQLAQLLEGEGIDVAAELLELERGGIIHRKTFLSSDEFRFGESLTQEVAYEGLLLKQRRELHERMGLLLEAARGEPTPERSALRAFHFGRSENESKALGALLQAASDAERLPSYRAAISFYRQAWNLAEAGLAKPAGSEESFRRRALEAALGLSRVVVFYGPSPTPDAERAVRKGRELAEELGDATSLAHLCAYHGMLLGGDREKSTDALALIEEGFAVAQRAGLDLPAISISRALAWSYLFDGRLALAQRTIAWAVDELERRGQREQLTDTYCGARYMRDVISYHSDDLAGALRGAAETYDVGVRACNRTVQSGAAETMAQVHFVRAEYAEAKRWADRSLELAQAIDSTGAIRTAAAIALAAGGELGESAEVARYTELIQQGLSSPGNRPVQVGVVVEALLGIGDVKRAERAAELAYTGAGGRFRETLSAAAFGDVMMRLGPERWREAEEWYKRAIALAETIGARSTLATATLGAAELAAARGDYDESARRVEQALALCRDLGLLRYQARGERLLAELSAGTLQTA